MPHDDHRPARSLSSLVREQTRPPVADPPDHEDGRAPEHPGDGARPGAGDLVRRRLGESRGAGRVPAGLSSSGVPTPTSFHKSGGYTATLGDLECREQIARFEQHLFGVPRLGAEHIAIGMGSTQLTHDLFRTLLDPGDTVMLLDPTYANYEGQLAFAAPGVEDRAAAACSIRQTWTYLPVTDPDRHRARLHRGCSTRTARAGAVRRARQSDQPGRAAGAGRGDAASAPPTPARGWRSTSPTSASTSRRRRRTTRGRRPIIRTSIGIHSNSKWARGLGRRLGWIEAAHAGRRGDRARAAVQHPVPRHAVADGDGAAGSASECRRLT